MVLITKVNFGSGVCLHMADVPKNMPFNYTKHKHGTAICWCDAQTHFILESSHLTDAHAHSFSSSNKYPDKKN